MFNEILNRVGLESKIVTPTSVEPDIKLARTPRAQQKRGRSVVEVLTLAMLK